MDELRREYMKERGYKIQEKWECEWWEHFKTDSSVKNHVKTNFTNKRPLSTDSLLEKKQQISFWLCAMQFNSSRRVEAYVFKLSSNTQSY